MTNEQDAIAIAIKALRGISTGAYPLDALKAAAADALAKMATKLAGIEPGPESSREEVAPMGRNTTRDWSTARLAAARHLSPWDPGP